MSSIQEEGKRWECATELKAMLDCPVWENHKRGKNWCATITKDPAAPNGLGRKFWQRAHGDYYYFVPDEAAVGDVLEIAADYVSGGRNRDRKRIYAVITAFPIVEKRVHLQLALFSTPARAFSYRILDVDAKKEEEELPVGACVL